MTDPLMAAGEARVERPEARDERQIVGTTGAPPVTNGTHDRPLPRAYALVTPLILLATIVNISSTLYDFHRGGKSLPMWEPICWEVTSAVSILVAVLIIPAAVRFAPPERGWLRVLTINALATLPFSAIHSGGMFALRLLTYRTLGGHYKLAASDFLYEYRKDLLTYCILYGVFWIATRPRLPPAAEAPRETEAADPIFTIIDGTRTHRATPGEILSLRAAGNYVEFHLASGNRPLMRGSLQEMQERLAAHGFLRTHRSWVVNPRRVRQLTALGSGDFLLTLDSGDEAPLSRRFPEALAFLRKKEGVAEATPSYHPK